MTEDGKNDGPFVKFFADCNISHPKKKALEGIKQKKKNSEVELGDTVEVINNKTTQEWKNAICKVISRVSGANRVTVKKADGETKDLAVSSLTVVKKGE